MLEITCQERMRNVLKGSIITRIENSVSVGVFDSNWVLQNGYEFWCEYKQIPDKSSQARFKIPLRDSQVVWAKRRMLVGATNLYIGIMIGNRLSLIHLKELSFLDKLRQNITLKDLALYSVCLKSLQERGAKHEYILP